MGIRAYADVELAQKRLSARAAERHPYPQYASGASAAYRWALGCAEHSPVTGAGDAEGAPALPALTAEVDASVVQMEDPTEAGPAHGTTAAGCTTPWPGCADTAITHRE